MSFDIFHRKESKPIHCNKILLQLLGHRTQGKCASWADSRTFHFVVGNERRVTHDCGSQRGVALEQAHENFSPPAESRASDGIEAHSLNLPKNLLSFRYRLRL